MNRVRAFLNGPADDWQAVRRVGELAAGATTPGDLWHAVARLFPDHSPYAPLPAHMKAGDGPEAALAVLVDGLRDGLNVLLEDASHPAPPGPRYCLAEPG